MPGLTTILISRCLEPSYQSKAWCKPIHVIVGFICMWTHFHVKGCASSTRFRKEAGNREMEMNFRDFVIVISVCLSQPRSQGFSLLNWGRPQFKREKPWERGCVYPFNHLRHQENQLQPRLICILKLSSWYYISNLTEIRFVVPVIL